MKTYRLSQSGGRGPVGAAALALTLGSAIVVGAGFVPVQAQEVVQQLPDPAAGRLNEAMRQLARNPVLLPALLEAGFASIDLGDVDAAEGFFERARAVAPNDGDVFAGLALVALGKSDPVTAIDLFGRAASTGANLEEFASDRGLAYDLVGDNASAQSLYGQSLAAENDDEVIRRMALSYAIAGDREASEAILLPLLQRRDLAAYRTRAFALAILGREEEAVAISDTMLPPRMARRLAPYLRYMARLSPSQQAAAANLGRFPTTANIGRDDPRVARRVTDSPPTVQARDAGSRLIPGGAPLGPRVTGELPALAARTAEEEVPLDDAGDDEGVELAAQEQGPPEPVPAPIVQQRPAPVVVAALDPQPAPPVTQSTEVELAAIATEDARPSFSLADAALPESEAPPQAAPEPAPSPASLAEAFADFSLDAAPSTIVAAAGAVDITAIEPRREQPRPAAPPPPPPPPPVPSRIWVQVATGQDVAAFRFDWRRMVRGADGALDGREPYRARWGLTNRLVTGPFASTREANEFVTRLKAAGIDSFRFTSAEGEEVVKLN